MGNITSHRGAERDLLRPLLERERHGYRPARLADGPGAPLDVLRALPGVWVRRSRVPSRGARGFETLCRTQERAHGLNPTRIRALFVPQLTSPVHRRTPAINGVTTETNLPIEGPLRAGSDRHDVAIVLVDDSSICTAARSACTAVVRDDHRSAALSGRLRPGIGRWVVRWTGVSIPCSGGAVVLGCTA